MKSFTYYNSFENINDDILYCKETVVKLQNRKKELLDDLEEISNTKYTSIITFSVLAKRAATFLCKPKNHGWNEKFISNCSFAHNGRNNLGDLIIDENLIIIHSKAGMIYISKSIHLKNLLKRNITKFWQHCVLNDKTKLSLKQFEAQSIKKLKYLVDNTTYFSENLILFSEPLIGVKNFYILLESNSSYLRKNSQHNNF